MAVATPDVERLAEEYEAEKPGRRLDPVHEKIVLVACAGLSLYAIYWVLNPVPAQRYRTSFLLVALAMTFLVYRGWGARDEKAKSESPGVTDWLLALGSVVALGYTLVTFDEFVRRAAQPNDLDIVFGIATILLVLEATRRTVGWILPAVVLAFLLYAYFGGELPLSGHRARWLRRARIVGQTYMGTAGIFGVPLDVAATYIVLFTLYGAVLEYSGAGRFFLDISLAASGQRRTAPGRTTALAGFLLGTVSGSGVATTVTLGCVDVADPAPGRLPQGRGRRCARRLGHRRDPLAADARRGRVHHRRVPRVCYLKVLLYAAIPSLLYYLGIFLAIEADARRFGPRRSRWTRRPRAAAARYGYHFSSLFAIVCCSRSGCRRSARCSTRRSSRSRSRSSTGAPDRAGQGRRALAAGTTACCQSPRPARRRGSSSESSRSPGWGSSCPGHRRRRRRQPFPVRAAGRARRDDPRAGGAGHRVFIIAGVIIGAALTGLGVRAVAADMFIFYYAVLSEVSPPTALSAVAAAAITGGNAFRTMLLTWKYTLPASSSRSRSCSPRRHGRCCREGSGVLLARGLRGRRGRARRGHRRVDDGPGRLPERSCAASPGWCCSSSSRCGSGSGSRSSRSAWPSTSWAGVRRRAGCGARPGSARRARPAARRHRA